MFKVLLVCYNNWDTSAEVPYILKKGGSEVHVYCSSKSWLLANSFYDKWIPCDGPDLKCYIDSLINLVQTENYNWVMLCDDSIIKLSLIHI